MTEFLKATGQRMARSAAAAMISVVVIGGGPLNAFDVDWHNVLGVGAGAAFVSLLLCLAGQATTGNGPSFGTVEQTSPPIEPDPPAGEHG